VWLVGRAVPRIGIESVRAFKGRFSNTSRFGDYGLIRIASASADSSRPSVWALWIVIGDLWCAELTC